MERLTMTSDKGGVAFTFDLDINCRPSEAQKILKLAQKLYEYEQAEEQGLLLRLPCKVGDDVYQIPSEVNYKLNVISKHGENNRVYHQKVARIVIEDGHWYMECDKDREYGTGRICLDTFFKETWFLAKEEAEQALAKMKEGV